MFHLRFHVDVAGGTLRPVGIAFFAGATASHQIKAGDCGRNAATAEAAWRFAAAGQPANCPPFRGPGCASASVGTRHAEHVLGQIGENEVGRDRRNLVKARLAKLALDIVFLGEAKAPMRLDAGIGRLV